MKGALYVDLGATCKVSERVMAYAKIDNLTDRGSPTAPGPNVGYGLNPSLFDVLGRMYRAGVRLTF